MSRPSLVQYLGLRGLLAAYPAAFRREFGEELLSFWLAQRREVRYSRTGGWLWFWRDVTRDAVATGARLRWRRGGVPSIRPAVGRPDRDPRFEIGRSTMLASVLHDLRYSLRFLRSAPLFTAVALVTLVLGIGTNTAIFGIVNGVLLRPLPYPEPGELVAVWRTTRGFNTVAVALPEFQALRRQATGLEAVTATIEGISDVQWESEARQHRIARVSADYFAVFGARPSLGRTFTHEEDVRGGPRVALISERLWHDRFGAAADILERSISVSQQEHQIIGVLRAAPEHPMPGTEIWLPLQEAQVMLDLGIDPDTRDLVYLDVYARLAAGMSVDAASREIEQIMRGLNEAEGREIDSIGGWAQPLHEATVGASRSALLLILGAVGLLLAIVCANITGLWLTRVAARTREVAVRTALGAGRSRVLRQLLTESLVLALLGGLGGVALARVLTGFLMGLAPDTLPRHTAVTIDGSVLLYAGAVSVLCGVVFGLLPAVRAAGMDPARTLRASGRSGSGMAGRRLQRALVVVQVGVAVVLLSGATLLANSYVRLVLVDPGFEPDAVLTASLSPPLIDGDTESVRAFYDSLLEQVRLLPGVDSATITYSPPMAQSNFRQTVVAEYEAEPEREDRLWAGTVIVGTDYFRTVGVSLLRGRDFTASDRLGQEHVAIANEALAAELWPGETPIGKRFRLQGGISGSADSFEPEFFPDDWITVIGVAADVRRRGLDEEAVPEFYRPHAQMSWPSSFLMVRIERAPAGFAEQLRRLVWSVSDNVPVGAVSPLTQTVRASVAEPRFRLILLGSFAVAACFLAMLGVYAVMTMTVSRHTHEIGVRMALGAGRAAVLRDVLVDGLKLAAVGLGLGLAVALATGHLLSAMLFEIEPGDPLTHTVVGLATLLVAAAACYVPARRAARLDPTLSLREG